MGSNYFTNPLTFIIDTLMGLYILTFMLRFLLQWVRADFFNPISQFLVKVTNPLLVPARRLLPGWGGIDLAALILVLILTALKLIVLYSFKGIIPGPFPLLMLSLAELIDLLINIFLFSIFIQVILSWIAPNQYNPVSALIYQLNEPLLRPARRLLPPVSGFDFSPMFVILLLYVSKMLLLPPIMTLAWSG